MSKNVPLVESNTSGFYVLPNALNFEEQVELAGLCLTTYRTSPYLTNCENLKRICSTEKHAISSTKLCWSELGYHYDWTSRSYKEKGLQDSPVPVKLKNLAVNFAKKCGYEIEPEAVIINYYHKKKSTMGGHQDDVEEAVENPVISISLGRTAVFLKGGLSKMEKPVPILLKSGDVVVMGGNSRMNFHGVARILSEFNGLTDTHHQYNEDFCYDNNGLSRKEILEYLSTHRININIRQVYKAKLI